VKAETMTFKQRSRTDACDSSYNLKLFETIKGDLMKLDKLMNVALTMGLMMGALMIGSALMPKADAMFATADLESKVEVFEDAACTKPVPNGANIPFSGGSPSFYVRLSVKNKGTVNAENFKVSYAVRRSGVDIYKTPQLIDLSLNANATKVFPVVQVPLSGTTNEVTASIIANPMKFMPEDNTSNNTAKIKVIGSVAH
jgi:CARDB